jgi:hypothetical protein
MLDATSIAYTSIYDEGLEWLTRGLNARTSVITLGELGDERAPGIGVIHCLAGPGDRLRARHAHAVDAINLVIDGAMYMDGVWLRPGQAKVVPAGQDYGDALVGPDGVRFLEIFAEVRGAFPQFHDAADQEYFEMVHGGHLRASTGLASEQQ